MICPKCEKDEVVFQGVLGFTPNIVELSFVCLECRAVFMIDVDEHDLREVKEDG